jgi:phage-related protein
MGDAINWSFYGYITPAGGKEVQDWFDGLPEEAQDEIRDVIGYLEHRPSAQWSGPQFKALGGGLSELRIKCNELNKTYRIYGFYWPKGQRHSYTLLLGRDKKVKNADADVSQARDRLSEIEQKVATTHEFEFSQDAD